MIYVILLNGVMIVKILTDENVKFWQDIAVLWSPVSTKPIENMTRIETDDDLDPRGKSREYFLKFVE